MWFCSGRTEQIPNPGDYCLCEVAGESFPLLPARIAVKFMLSTTFVATVEPASVVKSAENSLVAFSARITDGLMD